MATDKPFYKLAINHPAAILKLLGIVDSDDYIASSFTFKATENRRDLIFESRPGKTVLFVESHGYVDPYVYHGLLDGIMMYCRQKQFKRLALNMFNQLVGGFKMEDSRMGKELMGMGSRRVILRLIEHRFGAVPNNIRRRLERIYDAKRLDRIVDGLLEVKDIKQLKNLIGPNGKSASPIKGTIKASHSVSR